MSFDCKIIADSYYDSDLLGRLRLTTMQVTFPRIILAEVNTHRAFSRNSASSRAIPIQKMINMVIENPYVPSEFGRNQKGMSAGAALEGQAAATARAEWLVARDRAVEQAQALLDLGVHKQTTNRLLEPFMWHTAIITATDWDNFFHLRDHANAHPDIQTMARSMRDAYSDNSPTRLAENDWHLPYTTELERKELLPGLLVQYATARCARVSYLTQEGVLDTAADAALYYKLLVNGHMSPFEHSARPMSATELLGYYRASSKSYCGNFNGWVQFRKLIRNEHDILGAAHETTGPVLP